MTGTSRDLQTVPYSHDNTVGGNLHSFSSDELSFLASNQVTLRAFIHNTTTHTVNLLIWTNAGYFGVGTGVPAGTVGYSTITAYNVPPNITAGDISIRAYTENVEISGVQYKELKLEKGTKATPYMPSSSEVTPQDYPGYIGKYIGEVGSVQSTNPLDYDWFKV